MQALTGKLTEMLWSSESACLYKYFMQIIYSLCLIKKAEQERTQKVTKIRCGFAFLRLNSGLQ